MYQDARIVFNEWKLRRVQRKVRGCLVDMETDENDLYLIHDLASGILDGSRR